ncbi:MAG: ATP-binding protein, partial [Nitrospinaceae bacterium]
IQTHFEYGLLKPIQKFLHGEEDELERADKARKVLFARLKWFILLAAIGIPVIFGLFFLVLNRWIFLPLSRLMTASREIQGGNYEVHVPAATKDEMGNFIETFNAMAATLQQSFLGLRNHLALIVESTEDAVLGVDIKGNVISWNRGAEQIFGYPRSEIVGNSIAVLCPEDRHHELKNVLATIQAGRMDRFETQRLRKDGSKIDVSLTVSPLFEFNRNVTGASIIARDITAKKKMETELIRAKEVAEKASAGKSEFLTHLSHELRTPLNSLLGFAQLLELQAESKMGPEEKEFLQEILQAGQSLIHLINEVLDLSRIEAGEMDISMDMVDLSTVVAETFVQVQSLAKYENVSLKNQVSSREGLLALGDPVRVNQVLVNVLHNAIKYNVLGGSVTVFISFVEKDFLTLAIQDTGPGIAAEDLEKIFQPFTRLEKTAESKAGLGMGLAVAQRFMEVMGGTITVNSTVGMGTTFLLRLRRTYKSSELETAAPEPSHV